MWVFVGAALAALVAWVASNTYWEDVKVPMPLKGEARTNPFYVPQRFAEALGARTVWVSGSTIPPTDSVIVLSMWHWTLSASRRQALERWVESGGRLVVDETLAGDPEDFERWSGIVTAFGDPDEAAESVLGGQELCRLYEEELNQPHWLLMCRPRAIGCVIPWPFVPREQQGNSVGAPRSVRHPGDARSGRSRSLVTAINAMRAVPPAVALQRRSRPAVRGRHRDAPG